MKKNKITGIVLVVIGILFMLFSFYIKGEVEAGQKQLSQAEGGLGVSDKLFSITPETQDLGERATSPIQKKVTEGKKQIAFYTTLATVLEVGGIILIIVGASFFFLKRKNS